MAADTTAADTMTAGARTAPGQKRDALAGVKTAPGQKRDAPAGARTAPGQKRDAPAGAKTALGQKTDASADARTAPGQLSTDIRRFAREANAAGFEGSAEAEDKRTKEKSGFRFWKPLFLSYRKLCFPWNTKISFFKLENPGR